jgi:DNA-binding NarL/FixJ family response regulator
MGRGSILLVEDDIALRRSLSRWIRSKCDLEITEVDTVASAKQALADEPEAAIVDVRLPDGDGLELVEQLRTRSPWIPILVTTGDDSPEIANRAHLLGVMCVRKPEIDANIAKFVEQLAHRPRPNTQRALALLLEAVDLTPRQREIVELAMTGTKRSELAEALGLEESSVRTHVREIVKRVGIDNLDQLGWRMLALLDEAEDA